MEFSPLDRLKSKKYRFHYLAMPHLPVSKEYSACAFTQKVHKLTRMLLAAGHEVFLYGAGYTDIQHENLTFIPVITIDDLRKAYGEGDNRFELGYDWKSGEFKHDINQPLSSAGKKFMRNAIFQINKRKQDDDFLLNPQGYYYKMVADAVGLQLHCEPGIGYRGSYAPWRAFESTYIQNFTYGSEHPKESINGAYYDRVIPNYFDLEDFEFDNSPGNYLLFVGRLIQRKGIETAMRVADRLGKRLLVAGQGSLDGFSYKGQYAIHVGSVGVEERKLLFKKALVTLTPTIYLEPFCGVAVESMLSGTPVVSTDFGAFTDTVKNGVSGYRCSTLQDFVEKTVSAIKLDRNVVRAHALQYSMENVWPLYQKWFDDLYRVYISGKYPDQKAWHYVQ